MFSYSIYILSADNIWRCILLIIIKSELIYDELEDFLQNKNMCASPNTNGIKSRKMRTGGGKHRGVEKCIQNMLEKPEGKRQFGKPRHARENDIQMNLNKIQ